MIPVLCKAFDVVTGQELQDEFNAWYAANPGVLILQSHMIHSGGGPLLTVFYKPPEPTIVERSATQ